MQHCLSPPQRFRPGPGALIGLLLFGVASGCGRGQAEECPRFRPVHRLAPSPGDSVVAEVNGRPVTASLVIRRAAERGLDRKAALESLVDEELLVQEAERRGLHRDPEAILAAKQAAIYALLREGFEQDFTPGQVAEQELRKLYKMNERTHFNRPELRRFSHIFARRPWQRRGKRWVLDAEADQRLRAAFTQLHADVLAAAPESWKEFEALATRERGRGFSLSTERGTKSKDELQAPFAGPLFALSSPGSISEVLTLKGTIHIAFLVEVLPATRVSYEEARETILSRHFPEARRRAFERLLKDARSRCEIRVLPEHLPVSE